MLTEAQHIFWEAMGVLLGLILITFGIILQVETKRKLFNWMGLILIVAGIMGVIVDGFFFLPSWF